MATIEQYLNLRKSNVWSDRREQSRYLHYSRKLYIPQPNQFTNKTRFLSLTLRSLMAFVWCLVKSLSTREQHQLARSYPWQINVKLGQLNCRDVKKA
jgi:hypothetical protein